MKNQQGDFIWYELLSSDANAAQKFYGDVLGWTVTDSGQPGMDYRVIAAPDVDGGGAHPVGGLMQITAPMKAEGARPVWLGYIAVDDVDASVSKIVKAGGKIQMPATDIPHVGRIAMVTDPQGAPFYVMRGTMQHKSLAFSYDKPRPGHCAWNELSATDPKTALEFYGDQFGWVKDGEMAMGDMGAYEFLRHGKSLIGALMRKHPALPRPTWTYYFRVPDIDAAVEKTNAGGGKVVHGPNEIPGGDFALNAVDPQGATFSLVGSRKK